MQARKSLIELATEIERQKEIIRSISYQRLNRGCKFNDGKFFKRTSLICRGQPI